MRPAGLKIFTQFVPFSCIGLWEGHIPQMFDSSLGYCLEILVYCPSTVSNQVTAKARNLTEHLSYVWLDEWTKYMQL
jgi:hypothetical protein